MLSFIFPVAFPLALIGLVVLCVAARRRLAREEDPAVGRSALLMALTRIPVSVQVRSKDVAETPKPHGTP
ncbi:MAG TPA: hypothetical protein VIZ17_17260 [Acetobacteraceae bacterium]